jgi:hypothetical protein
MLDSIMAGFDRIEYIKPDDIPGIDLYMDQVTTFMDKKLKNTARYPGGDKILTKTMINNYAKNDLLPAPVKKKYSKEHVLVLIFIYYYKSFLSISDIQTLLRPITDKYFDNGSEFGLEEVYNEVFRMEKETVEQLKNDVREKYLKSQDSFENAPEKDRDFLKKFAFICELGFDVYVKKTIIEKMIDELAENMKEDAAEDGKKADNKKAAKRNKE